MIKLISKNGRLHILHAVKYQTPQDLDRAKKEERIYQKRVKFYESELKILASKIGKPYQTRERLHERLMTIVGRMYEAKIFEIKSLVFDIDQKIMGLENKKEPWQR